MVNKRPVFIAGGALPPNHPSYVLRQADRDADLAIDRDQMIYTIGPRQMGKSSILRRIQFRLAARGTAVCYIDLAALTGLPQKRWFQHLSQRVANACDYRLPLPLITDQEDLRNYLLDGIGLRRAEPVSELAILFDEVEGLLGCGFSNGFLMMLRELHQERFDLAGRLILAFSGCIDTDQLVTDPNISPFNIATQIPLTDFSTTQCASLTPLLDNLGVVVADDVDDRIYFWTAGQPYLTQRLCQLLAQQAVDGELSAINATAVDNAVTQVMLDRTNTDTNVKHVAREVEKLGVNAGALWANLKAGGTVLSTQPGFFALYLTGAVVEDDARTVHIRNRIYERAFGMDELPSAAESFLGTGSRWAILVGVNTYEDKSYNHLPVCAKDIASTRELLIAGGFDADHIILLTDSTDEPPTRSRILLELQSLAAQTHPDDLLLFYYSGHGDEANGISYLVAHDGRHHNLTDTAVAVSRVKEIMESAPAQAKVMILDACHAGANIGSKGAISPEFFANVFAQAEGLAILASCKQGQRSYVYDKDSSVFTHYLLEALKGDADATQKRFITVHDVSLHVTNRVKDWARTHQVEQTPTLEYKVAGDIILTRYQ